MQRYSCRIATGSRGKDKKCRSVKEGVHKGLSLLSGSWTGCHRSVLLPALLWVLLKGAAETVPLEPKDQLISRMALDGSAVSQLISESQKETQSAVHS